MLRTTGGDRRKMEQENYFFFAVIAVIVVKCVMSYTDYFSPFSPTNPNKSALKKLERQRRNRPCDQGHIHLILPCCSPSQSLTSLMRRHHGNTRHSPHPPYEGPGGLWKVQGFCHQGLLWPVSTVVILTHEAPPLNWWSRPMWTHSGRNYFCSPGCYTMH